MPDGKLLGEVQFLPWSEKNLSLALDEIANKFPGKLRIVVGEEFSYVIHFPKNDKKTSIINEAQTFIPEKLQDGWDSCEEKTGDMQVMAIQQRLFVILKESLAERNLQVEAIEVESVAIARLIHEEKNKTLIFARNTGRVILGIAQNSEILAAKVFSKPLDKKSFKEFIDYAIKPKNTYSMVAHIQDKSGDVIKIFEELGLELSEEELDPMVGTCLKKDISGRDRDVLNIFLDRVNMSANKNVAESQTINLREKILLSIFLLIFIGGAITVYRIQKSRQKTVKPAPITRHVQDSQSGLQWEK